MTKAELRALAEQAAQSVPVTKVPDAKYVPHSQLAKTGAESFFERKCLPDAEKIAREERRAKRLEKEAERHARRWEQDHLRDEGVTVVVDHCGREFYKNAEGEWL
jgi:hypothetical protein